jgi:SIR2-like domain
VLDFRLRIARAGASVPLDLDNIEEVFSLASATGDVSLSRSAALAIAATLDFAAANAKDDYQMILVAKGFEQPICWISEGSAESGMRSGRVGHHYRCPIYDYFLLSIIDYPSERREDRRDTIITFNYDLLIEQALRNLGIPFEYGFRNELPEYDSSSFCSRESNSREIGLLKLHGSLNWAVRENAGDKMTVFGTYDDVRKESLNPMLLPPTWQKVFRPQLSEVWDMAVRELQDATRIIILGYSMPPTDLHFKYLLAAGLEANNSIRQIWTVNVDRDLPSRFSNVFRPEIQSRLVHYVQMDTRSFLTRGCQEIGRGPSGRFF